CLNACGLFSVADSSRGTRFDFVWFCERASDGRDWPGLASQQIGWGVGAMTCPARSVLNQALYLRHQVDWISLVAEANVNESPLANCPRQTLARAMPTRPGRFKNHSFGRGNLKRLGVDLFFGDREIAETFGYRMLRRNNPNFFFPAAILIAAPTAGRL